VLLVWCGVAEGGVLYRCADGQGPPRWQERPCQAGEQQRTLEYEPAATKARAPTGSPAKPARRPKPRPVARGSRPRQDPAQQRAAAACREARAAARERSDSQGKRLPIRTIREREHEAARLCGR
jgi:hypothetical protein